MLFAASACIIALAACQKDVIPSVSIDEDSVTVSADENNLTIKLESNVTVTPVTDAEWVEAKVENGNLSINVDENYGAERSATVYLEYNTDVEATVTLTQSAGATDEIAEAEVFYYGHLDQYGAGTQNWTITFYNTNYMDDTEGAKYTYTFDLMASSEFTFVSGKFPTGTFALNPVSEVGAIYSINSNVLDSSTWSYITFDSATVTIEETEDADEYIFYVKGTTAKTETSDAISFKFEFKAVCGDTGDYDLRKYDTRVSSTIKKDYDITFAAGQAYCYEYDGTVKYIDLTVTKGDPAMGDNPSEGDFTDAQFYLYVPADAEDYSGTFNLDPDCTAAAYTIEYYQRYWWFAGVYPDPSDASWLRPLNHSLLYPSSGSMTLTKQSDGSYKIEGSFKDDYTDDYPDGKHTVTIHAQVNIQAGE
jgi:ribosomal protein L23